MKLLCLTVIILLALAVGEYYAWGEQAFRYESRGKRDPFVPLVGPDKTAVTGLDDVTSIEDVNLEGIAVGAGGKRIAIMNGEMLKEGDKVGILEVKLITKTNVTLLVGGKSYDLNLPEEGGGKGEK